ncbi:hypothetical protein HK096_010271 [Nowakowskiella sp. JEL0078]|nr:hypothetical protein HK096_010271 [Nowakowskiella sp. JEL0078]
MGHFESTIFLLSKYSFTADEIGNALCIAMAKSNHQIALYLSNQGPSTITNDLNAIRLNFIQSTTPANLTIIKSIIRRTPSSLRPQIIQQAVKYALQCSKTPPAIIEYLFIAIAMSKHHIPLLPWHEFSEDGFSNVLYVCLNLKLVDPAIDNIFWQLVEMAVERDYESVVTYVIQRVGVELLMLNELLGKALKVGAQNVVKFLVLLGANVNGIDDLLGNTVSEQEESEESSRDSVNEDIDVRQSLKEFAIQEIRNDTPFLGFLNHGVKFSINEVDQLENPILMIFAAQTEATKAITNAQKHYLISKEMLNNE